MLAAVALVVLVPGSAAAHNVLRSSTPADGASLESAPVEIALVFDQAVVELGTEVAMDGPDGPLALDPLVVDGETVTQPLPEDLTDGGYAVQWRATSADGHPISGELGFTLATPAEPEPTPTPTSAPPPTPAAADPAPTESEPAPSPTAPDEATGEGPGALGWVLIVGGGLAALAAGVAVLVAKSRPPPGSS